jgi:hypothetical protein
MFEIYIFYENGQILLKYFLAQSTIRPKKFRPKTTLTEFEPSEVSPFGGENNRDNGPTKDIWRRIQFRFMAVPTFKLAITY